MQKLFNDEMCYEILMEIAGNALENGCISQAEYNKMKAEWLEKYKPFISSLLLDI